MSLKEGFAVIGCSRCRRIMSADLAHSTKTCQCGYKIDLKKTRLLAVFSSAEDAACAVRELQTAKNSGFTAASAYKSFSEK